MKKEFQKKGIDTSKPYDTRDFAAIRKWAEEVAAKAR
jgi:menaquinone-dependent protoporphyrinogen oxidase